MWVKTKMTELLDKAKDPSETLDYACEQVNEHIAGLRESLVALDRSSRRVSEMGQIDLAKAELARERRRALLTEIRETLDQHGDQN